LGADYLNPVRAKLVDSVGEPDRYPWCGHGVVLGRRRWDWQDRDYVLSWFGRKEGEVREAYRGFVKKGMDQGRRPELVGGGMIRSLGGWPVVKGMGRSGMRGRGDERILGSGEFVEHLMKQASRTIKHQAPSQDLVKRAEQEILVVCRRENIKATVLRSGSRRRPLSRARSYVHYSRC
jgi:putative transposase